MGAVNGQAGADAAAAGPGSGPSVRCARIRDLLPDGAAFAAALAELPDWRRRKCDALVREADRRRSVAAWLLLRRLLAEEGVRAETLSVSENGFGKPAFDALPDVHFSVSHSDDRVMAAVFVRPVGCDVERIASADGAVVRAALSPGERAALADLPAGPDRDRAFTRLWVRKECLAKAIGRGLSDGPAALEVPADGDLPDWAFRDFDWGDGSLGCVCWRQPPSCEARNSRASESPSGVSSPPTASASSLREIE